MYYPDARVLVFAKAPVPGEVKTRLIPSLGEQGAAELHARLTLRTLDMVMQANVAPVELWCSPDNQHPFFRALTMPQQIQSGQNLGARMAHAVSSALVRSRFVILVGTDCPAMSGDYLRDAAARLAQGADAVIGPAEDGGYVLIGLSRDDARLFENVPWGTAGVVQATRDRLEESGFHWHELPCLWDVDRAEDVNRMSCWLQNETGT